MNTTSAGRSCACARAVAGASASAPKSAVVSRRIMVRACVLRFVDGANVWDSMHIRHLRNLPSGVPRNTGASFRRSVTTPGRYGGDAAAATASALDSRWRKGEENRRMPMLMFDEAVAEYLHRPERPVPWTRRQEEDALDGLSGWLH